MRSFVSYICGFCKCKRQKTDRWLADNPDLSGCANMVESPRTGFTSGECIFLLEWNLRVLYGQQRVFLGEVEHV